jgi:hypothetical protein
VPIEAAQAGMFDRLQPRTSAQYVRKVRSGILAVPDRPIRFFSDPTAARAWLDEPQVREWSKR